MPSYQVILVRYGCPRPPRSWRDSPADFEVVGRLPGGLCLPLANAWAQAFNRAERRRPRGLWAMVRREG